MLLRSKAVISRSFQSAALPMFSDSSFARR